MSLKFGTSGLRGLVKEMDDESCYLYTTAFLCYLKERNLLKEKISVGSDLRQSSDMICESVVKAIIDFGLKIDYLGKVSTPTLSYYSYKRGIASIMITGSHIPDDRNGIKFNMNYGEVLKNDEEKILEFFDMVKSNSSLSLRFDKKKLKNRIIIDKFKINEEARGEYIERYIKFFPKNCLDRREIVVYKHSSVARDILVKILRKLGGNVIEEGHSDKFIPVDTEAVRAEDIKLAKGYISKYKPDVIFSTDGDGDRPLMFDENGDVIKGDILGIMASLYLNAEHVSLPVSCNTSLEKFKFKVSKTKIGSPYVIESMNNALKEHEKIIGYEANGGYLLGSDFIVEGRKIEKLPTRDSVLVLICALLYCYDQNKKISEVVEEIAHKHVYSDSLKGIEPERGRKITNIIKDNIEEHFEFIKGKLLEINELDGLRLIFDNGEIVHLRQSGNSPELRCYSEADTKERAEEINKIVFEIVKKM
jgi:phosphomannomutase